jgi:hypothetical protein
MPKPGSDDTTLMVAVFCALIAGLVGVVSLNMTPAEYTPSVQSGLSGAVQASPTPVVDGI